MGKRYLVDSNVIIDVIENKLPTSCFDKIARILDENPSISIVNKIELLGFSYVKPEIIEFVNEVVVLGLTDEIASVSIEIRKTKKIKLPDAIIAATAIYHDRILLSRNEGDFANIKGLSFVNSWKF